MNPIGAGLPEGNGSRLRAGARDAQRNEPRIDQQPVVEKAVGETAKNTNTRDGGGFAESNATARRQRQARGPTWQVQS